MINGIPANIYMTHRARILPFLEGFAKRDLTGMTVADYEDAIARQDMQVWSVNNFQALALTEVTREAVKVLCCAGVKRREWQNELDDELRNWARALGKKRVLGLTRPGWYKWAKTKGYRLAHTQLVVEV